VPRLQPKEKTDDDLLLAFTALCPLRDIAALIIARLQQERLHLHVRFYAFYVARYFDITLGVPSSIKHIHSVFWSSRKRWPTQACLRRLPAPCLHFEAQVKQRQRVHFVLLQQRPASSAALGRHAPLSLLLYLPWRALRMIFE
jgi:hypothetical protein